MARKAARLERAGALTPRDRMWAAIRSLAKLPDCEAVVFSPVEVQFLANLKAPEPLHVDSVLSYLAGLTRANPPYLQLLADNRPPGRRRTELNLYALIRDVGVDAPRVNKDGKPVTDGLGGERMWTAIKVLREFDYIEVAMAASDREHTVAPEAAKHYLYHLQRAGYIAEVVEAKRGPHATKARYRFNRARNTGPRAPLVCRDKSVMDANTGAIVAPARKEAR